LEASPDRSGDAIGRVIEAALSVGPLGGVFILVGRQRDEADPAAGARSRLTVRTGAQMRDLGG
jgi:hypothetical protein